MDIILEDFENSSVVNIKIIVNFMKIAKIISTSFHPRSIRLKTLLCGSPPVYTLGSQNFTTKENIKDLILFQIEKEKKCDPGKNVDLVFVNNNIGSEWGNYFIDSLNNLQLQHGKVLTIQNNSNLGWSYGAYNKGYQTLNEYYDYFIFVEDDMIIAKDG